jgi:hypothetical protein
MTNPSRAAVAAETRQSGHTSRRRGSARRRRTPATAPRCYGARGRRQTAQGCSLPPYAAPGRLHDDEEVTAAGEQWRRRRARVRDPAACGVSKGGGYGSGGEFQGVRRGL